MLIICRCSLKQLSTIYSNSAICILAPRAWHKINSNCIVSALVTPGAPLHLHSCICNKISNIKILVPVVVSLLHTVSHGPGRITKQTFRSTFCTFFGAYLDIHGNTQTDEGCIPEKNINNQYRLLQHYLWRITINYY